MKKKNKTIIIFITIIVVSYCGIVFTDMSRVKSLKKPIFAIENGYMGSMTKFDGLGYKIGLDINATTGEITYGQMTGLGRTIIKVYDEKEAQIVETLNTVYETYYKMNDGTWQLNGISYKYRLEITGREPYAVKDSTYVYLSNIENIPFQKAYLAAGLSSSMNDYFPVEDAVFIDYIVE